VADVENVVPANPASLLDRNVATAFFGRFVALRPVQAAAITPILEGRNAVISSGTGSGKTEAAMAPLVGRYLKDAHEANGVTILYVAPTKALVNDLVKRLELPVQQVGLRLGRRHGDKDDLVSGPAPDVLVTTPESLDVLSFRGDHALETVKATVLDEVHLLYNTQRGIHLSILLRRLETHLGRPIQWVALSATVGDLRDVATFLRGSDAEATTLDFPASRPIDASILSVPDGDRFPRVIAKMMSRPGTKLLVFANSRRDCEDLIGSLHKEAPSMGPLFTHYSSLSTAVREETELDFARAPSGVCVATSTLELGIDIGDIDAIVLWGVPGNVESYLQRIGRGNRRAEKTNVVAFVRDVTLTPALDALRFLALNDAARRGELSRRKPYELFGAIAQQSLNMIAARNGAFTPVRELMTLVDHLDHCDRERLEAILDELTAQEYLQRHGFKNRYGAGEALWELVDYRMIYGNFPVGSQTVEVRHGAKVLGEIPRANLLRFRRGKKIRFAGKTWRVAKITPESVIVEPSGHDPRALDVFYRTPGIGFDTFVAEKLWDVFDSDVPDYGPLGKALVPRVRRLVDAMHGASAGGHIPFSRSGEGVTYFTFAGALVNRALALIAAAPESKAGDVALVVPGLIDWSAIRGDPEAYEMHFPSLFQPSTEQSVYQRLLPEQLQAHEFIQEWLKDNSVRTVLRRMASSTPSESGVDIAGLL